ncbi:PCYCGC motif-containing (lipo)protein [Paraburkholderia sp. BR14320]|uniref:PCYCGC motif-containing (lipo)protein n=1 Tax=unclassified Paraburkholderia TaxID=2615204 RepID=UPI0034CF3BC1
MKSQTSRRKVTRQRERKSAARWYLLAIVALILAAVGALMSGPLLMQRHETEVAPQKAASSAHSAQAAGWHVGMLRPDGLRIIPSGRSDASHVLNPNQFVDKEVRHAYWVATQIPAVLNKLYCWCGCENRGIHRSNLQCFEDNMAVTCEVCLGTAEIAWQMTQAGVQDAGKIQAGADARWGPKG